jgi:hypothetical protein
MRPDAHKCQEASNSSKLHPSRCHGNMSERSSEFKKILAFLRRHRVGRQLAPVWMSGQHRSDADILDKEITCIHFTFIQTTRQHRPDAVLVMAITYRQSATVRTLRQHRPDVALIWKRMKRVIESQLHRRLSRRSILPSRCCLEKSEIDSI